MSEIMNMEELQFKASDNSEKAILGTLEGPCADIIDSTRNGRKYSDALWEKTFNDPIVTEMIENGGIPGELDHPADREEIDSARIAILMKDKPIKKDGKLWAKFSILNTPLGKIAYTLAKAGFKLGVSSRGSGDTYTDYNGDEVVDEDTYDFKCFDLVLLPAVKAARLNLVTEGLSKKKVNLTEAFNNIIKESTEDEKKVIDATLKNLKIEGYQYKGYDLTETDSDVIVRDKSGKIIVKTPTEQEAVDFIDEYDPLDDDTELDEKISTKNCITNNQNENSAYHKEVSEVDEAANDESDIYIELQEAYQQKSVLENKVIELQEKLSACYTKESQLKGNVLTASTTLTEQVNKNKELETKLNEFKELNEQYKQKVTEAVRKLEIAQAQCKSRDRKIDQLTEQLEQNTTSNRELTETFNKDKATIKKLTEQLSMKQESFNSEKKQLTEQIEKLQKDIATNKSNYASKLEKANAICEKYKNVATKAVDKYIDSQAVKLGISSNEIKNKLPESYSFNDIDQVCESLQQYKLNMNKLPFRTGNAIKENVQFKVKSSKKEAIKPNTSYNDDIDDSLLKLAGLD